MKKLVMLVAAAAAIAAQAEQSVVPSTSYVQRGLLCHFDALDNAGRGTHSSSATTWVDLTGNGNDATVHFVDAKGNALKGHWGSRALCSTGSTDGVYADFVPSSALLDKVNSDGPWTYEVVDCQDCTRHGTSYEFGCSGVFGKNQGSNDLRGYFYIRGANTGWTDVNKASSYCSRPHVIAYVHDGTNISRYRDGVVDSDWATVAAPKGSKPMTVS